MTVSLTAFKLWMSDFVEMKIMMLTSVNCGDNPMR
jgi:hypothetical protein